jgi:hypothetical protein
VGKKVSTKWRQIKLITEIFAYLCSDSLGVFDFLSLQGKVGEPTSG